MCDTLPSSKKSYFSKSEVLKYLIILNIHKYESVGLIIGSNTQHFNANQNQCSP